MIRLIRQCETYIEASKFLLKPTDCKSSLPEAIGFIEESTGIKTSRAKSLCDCEIKDNLTAKPMMELKASDEIIEISYAQLSRILRRYEEGIVGGYHPKTGRIFLVEGQWCFSNLVHEALHSRSVFSKRDPFPTNLEFVSDGLTELLVGLVLKKKIPPCYKKWQIANSCFLLPYAKFVRPWYYLTLRVDFKPIISLYFDVGEKTPLEKLGELLRDLLDSKFENVFLNYDPNEKGFFDRFKDQLGRVLGEDFASFLGSQKGMKLDHLNCL